MKEEEEVDEKLGSPDPEKGDVEDDATQSKHKVTAPEGGGRSSRKPKYDASLTRALHYTFFWRFWIAGILKLVSGK